MLVRIAHQDWVDPTDISAIDSSKDTDGTVKITVILKNGAKLLYSKQEDGKAREMARVVNDALEQLQANKTLPIP